MTYAVVADVQLRLETPHPDETKVQAALDDGAALIDAYCRQSFEVPYPAAVTVVNITVAIRLLGAGWGGGVRQEGVGGYSVTYERGMPYGLTTSEEALLKPHRTGVSAGAVQWAPSGQWRTAAASDHDRYE